MLKWAIILLVLSMIAGALGFSGISATLKRISLVLFAIFILLFMLFIALAIGAGELLMS